MSCCCNFTILWNVIHSSLSSKQSREKSVIDKRRLFVVCQFLSEALTSDKMFGFLNRISVGYFNLEFQMEAEEPWTDSRGSHVG